MYVYRKGKNSIYIFVFVDDLLICCEDRQRINNIKSSLMQWFAIEDLGTIGQYIGINIDYCEDRSDI